MRSPRRASRMYVNSLKERQELLKMLLPQHTIPTADESTSPEAASHPGIRQDDFVTETDWSQLIRTTSWDGSVANTDSSPIAPAKRFSLGRALSMSDWNPEHWSASLSDLRNPDTTYKAARSVELASGGTGYSATTHTDSTGVSSEQNQSTKKILDDIPAELRDYALSLFWTHYNNIVPVVHMEAFLEDEKKGGSSFYTGFLHLCMIAIGCKLSDANAISARSVAIQTTGRTLRNVANLIADHLLGASRNLPTIQALLLLSDLEFGDGKEAMGRKYLDSACRLCFEIGLNRDNRRFDLSHRDALIRGSVFCACVVYDRHWALFLGLPSCIESAGLKVSKVAGHCPRRSSDKAFGLETSFELQIYNSRLLLTDLSGDIIKYTMEDPTSTDSYFKLAALDRRMNAWYENLPECLEWLPNNLASAPSSFFLLYEEYHATLIVLHRKFTSQRKVGKHVENEANSRIDRCVSLSQTVCFNNAARIATIFKKHRQNFNPRQNVSSGIHPIGSALMALLARKRVGNDVDDGLETSRYIQDFIQGLEDLAHAYPLTRQILSNVNPIPEDPSEQISVPRAVEAEGSISVPYSA